MACGFKSGLIGGSFTTFTPAVLGLNGLISEMNVRAWLSFEKRQRGKRLLNKLAGGLLTAGTARCPYDLHDEARDGLSPDRTADTAKTSAGEPFGPPAGASLHKVTRGDWIRTSDFVLPKHAL